MCAQYVAPGVRIPDPSGADDYNYEYDTRDEQLETPPPTDGLHQMVDLDPPPPSEHLNHFKNFSDEFR